MLAVQLKNEIETTVGLEVNLVQLLEGPSIAQVAQALSDDFAGEPPAAYAPAVSRQAADDRPASLDHLSDEEVDALLLRLSGHGGDAV
jgi:hypothetical protein